MGLDVVILAAGEGTRMRSRLPKVLHPLAGKPLLAHVIDAARALEPTRLHVVHGHHGERVRAHFHDAGVEWVEQAERLGTGHAVQQVMPAIASESTVLVLYGDVPLIGVETLRRLLDEVGSHGLAIVTAILDDPAGYGRIIRDGQGRIERIVEHKDATDEQHAIDEINTGILAAHAALLARCLARLDNNNTQREYYLTDVIALAAAEGIEPGSTMPDDNDEILGVNDRAQLAQLESAYQTREAERLMRDGATLRDPTRIDVRGRLTTGTDVTIDVNCVFEGSVEIADDVTIGPNCVIRDARIGKGTRIDAHSVIDSADIGRDCRIGPFARIRPETLLADGVHIGNFVEIKKSEVGRGSKINHLSYVGDTTVGSGVNIGAGTITCNYDGANKHRTVIGDGAFIGSDTQLVAPVRVGAGATIGAGSTITRDAPDGELTLSRAPQQTRKGWKRPVKKDK